MKQFGILEESGFRIEKLAYESLPGFRVTANLYVPASGGGPFPAVLLTPGHEATGKQSQYSFGANFARSGIIALAIDPLGQGERLQYFDPAQKKSIIGGSTGEHGEANVLAMLIGEDIARYFVNDGMRGIDYLIGRPDVDANRIGALGCSGAGTADRASRRARRSGEGCRSGVLHHRIPRIASLRYRRAGGGAEHSAFHRTGAGFRRLGRVIRTQTVRADTFGGQLIDVDQFRRLYCDVPFDRRSPSVEAAKTR